MFEFCCCYCCCWVLTLKIFSVWEEHLWRCI